MKYNRAIVIPSVLAAYLVVMAAIGYRDYAAGLTSPVQYFGVIVATAIIIVVLHFAIKHRDRLRQERIDDINKKNNTLDKQ